MLVEEYPDNDKVVDYKMMGISILSSRIRQYLQKHPDATLRDYVNLTAILGDENSSEGDKVNLMTMHAAKGLEFDVVYIAGCDDHIIPSARSLEENPANIAEERRLFYVAITRAKKILIINTAQERMNTVGESKRCIPSRFLEEIPSTLFQDEEEAKKEERTAGLDSLRALRARLAAARKN